MSKQTFAERCKMFEQCLPDAPYRDLLTALHAEMLTALAEQPAPVQQEPWGYLDERDEPVKFKTEQQRKRMAHSIERGGLQYLYITPQAPKENT